MSTIRKIAIFSTSDREKAIVELSHIARSYGWEVIVIAPNADDAQLTLEKVDIALFRISPRNYPYYDVLVRDIPLIFHTQLSSMLKAFDKIESHTVLGKHQIPTPITWCMSAGSHFENEKFVIKIRRGNQGKGVALIDSNESLQAFFSEYPNETEFLCQEFIAEAESSDKRLFVVGGNVIASMRRQSNTGDFRANLHLGAKATVYQPTKEEEILAVKCIEAFGLEYGGVDIIDSERGPLVLEINPSPGFAIAKITSVDVAQKVFKYSTRSYDD